MEKNGMWIPIVASVGVGLATYYTVSKNHQTIGQTVQKVLPIVSQMSSGQNSQQFGSQGQGLS